MIKKLALGLIAVTLGMICQIAPCTDGVTYSQMVSEQENAGWLDRKLAQNQRTMDAAYADWQQSERDKRTHDLEERLERLEKRNDPNASLWDRLH